MLRAMSARSRADSGCRRRPRGRPSWAAARIDVDAGPSQRSGLDEEAGRHAGAQRRVLTTAKPDAAVARVSIRSAVRPRDLRRIAVPETQTEHAAATGGRRGATSRRRAAFAAPRMRHRRRAPGGDRPAPSTIWPAARSCSAAARSIFDLLVRRRARRRLQGTRARRFGVAPAIHERRGETHAERLVRARDVGRRVVQRQANEPRGVLEGELLRRALRPRPRRSGRRAPASPAPSQWSAIASASAPGVSSRRPREGAAAAGAGSSGARSAPMVSRIRSCVVSTTSRPSRWPVRANRRAPSIGDGLVHVLLAPGGGGDDRAPRSGRPLDGDDLDRPPRVVGQPFEAPAQHLFERQHDERLAGGAPVVAGVAPRQLLHQERIASGLARDCAAPSAPPLSSGPFEKRPARASCASSLRRAPTGHVAGLDLFGPAVAELVEKHAPRRFVAPVGHEEQERRRVRWTHEREDERGAVGVAPLGVVDE